MILMWAFSRFSQLAQAATGKQGVLGPTKIYLAVQPAQSTNNQQPQVSQSLSTSITTASTPKQQAKISSLSTGNILIHFFISSY